MDNKKRSALDNYIDHYSSLDNPKYAVLVNGPWGIGKTYQVKKCLEGRKHHYVSLYGLKSISEVHSEVLSVGLSDKIEKGKNIINNLRRPSNKLFKKEALSVGLSGKIEKVKNSINALGGGLDKLFKTEGEVSGVFGLIGLGAKFWAELNLDNDAILVFDDLERSSLWNENGFRDLLGAINFYVEHKGFRTIVICNDEDVPDGFLKEKEKVFGRTIRVSPDYDAAFDSFVSAILGDSSNFLVQNKKIIKEIWGVSKCKSLRILNYALNDVSRLRSLFPSDLLSDQKLLEDILIYFLVLFLEFYSGSLSFEDFYENPMKSGSRGVSRFSGKYALFRDFSSFFMVEGFVLRLLFDGVFDEKGFRQCLLNMPQFYLGTSPCWKKLVQFEVLSEKDIEETIQDADYILKQGLSKNIGEFLHLSAMALLIASRASADPFILTQVQSDCLGYMVKSFNREDFIIISRSQNPFIDRFYEGYGYWVTHETKEYFDKIVEESFKYQDLIASERADKIRERFISKIQENPDAWFWNVIQDKDLDVPLERISASIFVESWLRVQKKEIWLDISRSVARIVKNRILSQNGAVVNKWVDDVFREIKLRADQVNGDSSDYGLNASALIAYRIERLGQSLADSIGLTGNSSKPAGVRS